MSDDTNGTAKNTDGDAAEKQADGESRPVDTVPTREIGGRDGPDPTRYGDWEKNGRCVDF